MKPSCLHRRSSDSGPPVAADLPKGSSNFAVSGAGTRDGRAIVANDRHLGLRAPGTWCSAGLRYPDLRAPGGKVHVQGFTLPGLPAVVVGRNGHLACAFTNSYVHSTDWKRVVPCASAKPATASCMPITAPRETTDVPCPDAAALPAEDAHCGPIPHNQHDLTELTLR